LNPLGFLGAADLPLALLFTFATVVFKLFELGFFDSLSEALVEFVEALELALVLLLGLCWLFVLSPACTLLI